MGRAVLGRACCQCCWVEEVVGLLPPRSSTGWSVPTVLDVVIACPFSADLDEAQIESGAGGLSSPPGRFTQGGSDAANRWAPARRAWTGPELVPG